MMNRTEDIPEPPHEMPALPHRTQTRILYIDHTAKLGGGEIALLHLVQHLNPVQYKPIVVLSADGPMSEKLRESGIETHVLALAESVLETRKDTLGLKTALRLRDVAQTWKYIRLLTRFMRDHRIELVHTNSLKADIIGGIAARLARLPLLWHVRDRIDANYLPRSVVWVFRLLCRWLPHYVIANSESTLQTLGLKQKARSSAVYSGIDFSSGADTGSGSRVHVVHDGVQGTRTRMPLTYAGPLSVHVEPALVSKEMLSGAASSAASRPASLAQEEPVRIALIGRIARWKGQHIFLQAAALVRQQFPAIRFQIIGAPLFGEEKYEAEIRSLTASLGLEENVEFLGFRTDIPALLGALTIVVHASISAEPFGQVIVEGMAAGKPVVATNGGGPAEVVENGKTGLLVPMGDHEAMADAIVFLLRNPEAALEMGRRGRQRAGEMFSIEGTVSKIEGVYREMLPEVR